MCLKSTCSQQLVQRSVLAQKCCRRLGPDTCRAGNPVGRVAAQGDEIRHLMGPHAVTLHDLGRADPGQLPGLDRLDDGRALRDQLKGIPIAGGNDGAAFSLLFLGDSGGEEVVGS